MSGQVMTLNQQSSYPLQFSAVLSANPFA